MHFGESIVFFIINVNIALQNKLIIEGSRRANLLLHGGTKLHNEITFS